MIKSKRSLKTNKDKIKTNPDKNQSKLFQRNSTRFSRSKVDLKNYHSNGNTNEERRALGTKVSTVMTKQAKDVKPSSVQASIPEPQYQYEMSSSINDFDEYIPIYDHSQYKHSASKKPNKNVKINDKSSVQKQVKMDQIEIEKLVTTQCRKDLVKIQKRNKIKQMKEQKEKERLEEERKKQNLEALNNMFKKKHQNYKKKKEIIIEKENDF